MVWRIVQGGDQRAGQHKANERTAGSCRATLRVDELGPRAALAGFVVDKGRLTCQSC